MQLWAMDSGRIDALFGRKRSDLAGTLEPARVRAGAALAWQHSSVATASQPTARD